MEDVQERIKRQTELPMTSLDGAVRVVGFIVVLLVVLSLRSCA